MEDSANVDIDLKHKSKKKSQEVVTTFDKLASAVTSLGSKIRGFAINTIVLDRFLGVFQNISQAVFNFVNVIDVAKKGKEIANMASQWELATDKFQAFALVAESFGTERNDLADALFTLNEYSEEFIRGKGHVEDFKLGGFIPKDFKDKNIIDRFIVFADKLKDLKPSVRGEVIAKSLGDDLSKRLGSALSKGGTAILNKMNDILKKRLVLLKEELEFLKRIHEAYFDTKSALTLTLDRLSISVGLVISKLLPGLTAFLGKFSIVLEARVFVMLDKIVEFLNKIGDKQNALTVINDKFEGLENTIYRLGRGIFLASAAIGSLVVMLNPYLLAFGAIFTLSVLIADSIATWAEGGKSFLAPLLDSPQFAIFLEGLKSVAIELLGIVKEFAIIIFEIATSKALLLSLGTLLKLLSYILKVAKFIVHIVRIYVQLIMSASNAFSYALLKDATKIPWFNQMLPDVNKGGRLDTAKDSTGTETVNYNTVINTNKKEIEIVRPSTKASVMYAP